MIIGDIETSEKIEYEDLLKNYYEKMEIIEEQGKEIERLNEDNKYLNKVNIELSTEKNRLNNIINKAIEYINENGMTNITWLGNKTTKRELFKENASLYELREILAGSDKE